MKTLTAPYQRLVCDECDAWIEYELPEVQGKGRDRHVVCPKCWNKVLLCKWYWILDLPLYALGFVIVGGSFMGVMWLTKWAVETIKSLI